MEIQMKISAYCFLLIALSSVAGASSVKYYSSPQSIENARLQFIEQQLEIQRFDWVYELEQNHELEVIWYQGEEIIKKWNIEQNTFPLKSLSLVLVSEPAIEKNSRTKITFGPSQNSTQTSFPVLTMNSNERTQIKFEDLKKLQEGGGSVKFWSLETNLGSGLEPYMYATVRIIKKSNQNVDPTRTTPAE
jgi:hypothetical protein